MSSNIYPSDANFGTYMTMRWTCPQCGSPQLSYSVCVLGSEVYLERNKKCEAEIRPSFASDYTYECGYWRGLMRSQILVNTSVSGSAKTQLRNPPLAPDKAECYDWRV